MKLGVTKFSFVVLPDWYYRITKNNFPEKIDLLWKIALHTKAEKLFFISNLKIVDWKNKFEFWENHWICFGINNLKIASIC